MSTKIDLSEYLKKLREKEGCAALQVSGSFGKDRTYVYQAEREGAASVSGTIQSMLDYYGKSVGDMLLHCLEREHFRSDKEWELFKKLVLSWDVHLYGKAERTKTITEPPIKID